MRALWITERFLPDHGGAAVAASRQVARLAARLDRIDVLRLSNGLEPGRVQLEDRGGAHVYRIGRAPELDESLQLLAQTATNLLEVHRHQVVHGFYAVHAGFVATTVARRAGVPAVVSLRGNDVARAMFHGPRLPFLLWTLENADALVGVSQEILRTAGALSGRTRGLHYVPNGIDETAFAAKPDGTEISPCPRPWIAFAGEARLKKGLPILRDLAELLESQGRGTLLWIGGARRGEQPRGSTSRIRVIPYIEDRARLAALLGAVDLFVFPSLWDGMPNALLEAMAAGRPAIASAIGAHADLIEHERTGFLVPLSALDRFPRLALEALDRGPAELDRIGAAARERVRRDFSAEAEAAALEAVYASLAP